MSIHYENTANKLRPKTFNELTGQEFVVSTVCSSIEQDNIAPAYLFSGPRGVGKTSTARLVALAINRPEQTPVNTLSYEGSEDIRLGKSLDVIEIDGASYTSIENVRNIREEILYPPVHFRYKVYIIDEVHMLSNSAFNALLKTIEEPPSYVVFIFATTELHKVPATIRSRCQQFSFHLISISEISNKLKDICDAEHIEAEPAALQWIAKEAQGSFRDAYTLFDQIRAFSKSSITLQKIKETLGLAGLDTLNEIFSLCLEGKRKETLTTISEILAQGISVEQFVMESAEYVRNLLFLKAQIHAEATLGYSPSMFKEDIYQGFSTEQLEKALALLLECYRTLRFSSNPRFELELVFSQFCEIASYITPQQLVAQLSSLKQRSPSSPNNGESAPAPARASAPPSHTTPTLQEPTLEELIKKTEQSPEETPAQKQDPPTLSMEHSLWDKVVSNIRTKNESLALVLDSAKVEEQADEIQVLFHNQYGLDKYHEYAQNIKLLTQRIANREIVITPSLEEADTTVPLPKNDIMNEDETTTVSDDVHSADTAQVSDHLSQDESNILKVFGGQIKDESH